MGGLFRYRRRIPPGILARGILAGIFLGILVFLVVSMGEMKSMLTRLATSRVTNTVNQIVLESVDLAVDSGTFQYDRMISFEKDNSGGITAVKSNMPEFNRLQSFILAEVLDRIDPVSSGQSDWFSAAGRARPQDQRSHAVGGLLLSPAGERLYFCRHQSD